MPLTLPMRPSPLSPSSCPLDLFRHSQTLDELEDYTEGAHSSILYLLLEVLGVRNKNADYCASHIGVCAGLTTLLRGTAFHATRGAIYLPRETAGKVNLVDSVLLKGPQTESEAKALQEAVFDVASQVRPMRP